MTGFPADLSYVPLKYVCRVNTETLPEDTPEDLEIEYIDISSVDALGAVAKPESTTFKEAPSRARRIVHSEDVLISTVRTYLKAIAHVPQVESNLICSTGFAVLTAGLRVVPRFLFYWVSSTAFVGTVVSRSVGVSYPAINPVELMCLPFPQQPTSTQATIARFLDRELALIDDLVMKKQRLIEMLDEKRRALITRVVTRGLDPSVLMKESPVAWLGRIPAHWTPLAARRLIVDIEQGASPIAEDAQAEVHEYAVLKLSSIKKGRFVQAEHKRIPDQSTCSGMLRVRAGDLLITRANTPELVGDTCVVPAGVRDGLLLPDLIYRLTPRLELARAKFLMYALLCGLGRGQIEADARGSSGSMVKISQSHVKDWLIFVPPLDEQDKITQFCDRTEKGTILACEVIGTAIDRLREYRSALITAAVTGQLDIRKHEEKMEVLA